MPENLIAYKALQFKKSVSLVCTTSIIQYMKIIVEYSALPNFCLKVVSKVANKEDTTGDILRHLNHLLSRDPKWYFWLFSFIGNITLNKHKRIV